MSAELTPEVLWAQRSSSSDAEKNYPYLSLMVPDVPEKDMKLDIKPAKLSFNGYSNTKKATYKVDLDFYAEIDPENSKIRHTGRDIEMMLRKKELKEEYWPRLLKESKKLHFLKTDFDKWVDEDEQEDAPEDESMNQMAGMGGDGGFGGIDFSKLGGAGGMPDMSALGGMGGMPGAGDLGGEEGDESSDDEMPELEEEGKDADKPGNAKIEEVS